jgi:GNAT superfamily N-acetyltransferase
MINLRPISPEDTEECGRIIYEAFLGIADKHNFPPDFLEPAACMKTASTAIGSPHAFGVAAEVDGRFVGSNFLWEYDEIQAVGPITVDPCVQAKGIGRALMNAVIELRPGAPGIRLVQDGFNTSSLSLYASLGFQVVEPLALLKGSPSTGLSPGVTVRRMEAEDLETCDRLYRQVHGFSRKNETAEMAAVLPSCVVERDGRITGFLTAPGTWTRNYGVAETQGDMAELIAGSALVSGGAVAFLLPTRQADLFRWSLASGLRVIKPLTLMAMGSYNEPKAAFFPSVHY